jgi:hypothetical protein
VSYAIAKGRELVSEPFEDVVDAMRHKREAGLVESDGYELARVVSGQPQFLTDRDRLELSRRAREWR